MSICRMILFLAEGNKIVNQMELDFVRWTEMHMDIITEPRMCFMTLSFWNLFASRMLQFFATASQNVNKILYVILDSLWNYGALSVD